MRVSAPAWIWKAGGLVPAAIFTAVLIACADPVADPEPVEPGAPVTRFEITVPGSTPPADTVWISGNAAELGQWNGAGLQLARQTDGIWAAEAEFAAGTTLEFKVTRGSWNSVEKGAMGEEIANRRHVVNGTEVVKATVAAWRDQTEGPPPESILTGTIRYHRNVASTHLPRSRDLIVYLPPDYLTAVDRRYPVLYLHDGQNLMDAATSFLGVEWGADETAERLIAAGTVEPLILVGVYNTPDRIAEYTPRPDDQNRGGNAENYARFLVEELKPFIDATYRTKPEPSETGVAGSSLGGIVSMYLGVTRSDTFTRIGVISPAVWFANSDIVTWVNESPKRAIRIWEDVGTAEDGNGQTLAGARLLRDALITKGWAPGVDFMYLEAAGAAHNEAAWAARFAAILTWLYPARP